MSTTTMSFALPEVLRRFAHQLHTWPAYITDGERGAGFAEVAARLLSARAAAC